MLGFSAAIAAALAVMGVYGVLSYLVAQRTREIGVRMALGATRTDVLARIVRNGFLLISLGIVLGLVGAAATTRVLDGMLFGITSLDPLTFVAVAVMFAAVATFASCVPARRATMVDPMIALRNE